MPKTKPAVVSAAPKPIGPVPTMPKPHIELKPIEWLKPYGKNAKLHPDEQIERLAATIRRFGWDQPIVAEADGTIIKGHGRRLAAMRLGLTEVPVWIRDDLSQEEAAAARISDNAVFSMQYDTATMEQELRRLSESMPNMDFKDLGLTGKDWKILMDIVDAPEASAIMEDTQTEVERAKAEGDEAVDRTDNEEIVISKALGFSKISRADQRAIGAFMAEAEDVTGKEGREAFIEGLRIAINRGLS